MSKLVPALLIAAAVGGSFALGRWWRPSKEAGEKPHKKAHKKHHKSEPPKDGGAKERIAALAKSDPEIASFAKAHPELVAKAMKNPGSVASDPTFLAWAATHGAQVAAIQRAMRGGGSPEPSGLALPAGPATVGELGAAEPTATLQPGEVAPILEARGVWGGIPFDPNGKAGDAIFGAIERAGFKGRFDASLRIDEKGNVSIDPTVPALKGPLQAALGGKMTAAIKASRRELPAGGLVVPWLEGVGNG